ncbi:PilZ domain-containing protein [Sphingomicrobium clamense]|nr:PilZ domain-containing protein [Sphingomicrobium sp. B8]
MYHDNVAKNRAEKRSHVLMTCELEAGDTCKTVKLRNLSAHGAMVEDDTLPLVGTQVLFKKGDIRATGTVVWARIKRAGIKFDTLVPADQIKRHVPKARPKPQPKSDRPGLKAKPLTAAERRAAEHYFWGDPLIPPTR